MIVRCHAAGSVPHSQGLGDMLSRNFTRQYIVQFGAFKDVLWNNYDMNIVI